ncbi:MAG: hypothetical protein P1U86_19585 [Verrucomicrobiales bacterium]|nr:hypothetical protein [Verrucomicrobiales bacterium]
MEAYLLKTNLILLHLFATLGMVGVIWTVQLVIYPLFSSIGRDSFHTYHARYMKRITWIVGPLMLIELTSAFLLPYLFWTSGYRGVLIANASLVVSVWLITGLIQVPAHRGLSEHYSTDRVSSLVRGNWIRTAIWTARLPLLASFAGKAIA